LMIPSELSDCKTLNSFSNRKISLEVGYSFFNIFIGSSGKKPLKINISY